MKISHQSGFAHLGIVVAIVVIAAVGGAGYLVFAKNNKSGTSNSATSPTTSASTSDSSDKSAVEAAAKTHFALVYQKKLQEAYASSCQEFKNLTPYSEFQAYLDKNSGFQTIDLSQVEYSSVDVRADQARISGPVGPLAPQTTLQVDLLKKNDQWCIYGYKTI